MAMTELHRAARRNDLVGTQSLISRVNDVNERDGLGRTPLHHVAIKNYNNGYFKLAAVLLENGADLSLRDYRDFTPIEYLIKNGGVKIVLLFISYDLHLWQDMRWSLLFAAAYYKNLKILEILLEDYQLDVNRRNEHGLTPLHFATAKNNNGSHSKVIKLLLEKGARIDLKDNKGFTPIWYLFKDNKFLDKFKKLALFFNFTEGAAELVPKFTGESIREKDIELLLAHTDFGKIVTLKRSLKALERLPLFIAGCVMKHIAKFETLDYTMKGVLVNVIKERQEYEDFYYYCLDEVNRAKYTTIEYTVISYYSLLIGDAEQMRDYARDDALIAGFFGSDCRKRFLIYGDMMEKNVDEGIRTGRLMH